MREIKFRAWDEGEFAEEKCMIEWNDTFFSDMSAVTMYGSYFSDISMPLMQYIGRKDKNGKEIYEGDICKYAVLSECNNEDCINYSEVEYKQGVCEIIHGQCVVGEVALPWAYNIDIIGNKHENPDLLEEK